MGSESDSGSSQATRSNPLTVPSGRALAAVGFRSHGPRSRTPSSIHSFLSPWIWIGRRRFVVLLARGCARVCSAPWQRRGPRFVASPPRSFNGSLCSALIARRVSSSGSRRSTCSRRSRRPRGQLSRGEENPMPSWLLGYLSPSSSPLASFTHPETPTHTHRAAASL